MIIQNEIACLTLICWMPSAKYRSVSWDWRKEESKKQANPSFCVQSCGPLLQAVQYSVLKLFHVSCFSPFSHKPNLLVWNRCSGTPEVLGYETNVFV